MSIIVFMKIQKQRLTLFFSKDIILEREVN